MPTVIFLLPLDAAVPIDSEAARGEKSRREDDEDDFFFFVGY